MAATVNNWLVLIAGGVSDGAECQIEFRGKPVQRSGPELDQTQRRDVSKERNGECIRLGLPLMGVLA